MNKDASGELPTEAIEAVGRAVMREIGGPAANAVERYGRAAIAAVQAALPPPAETGDDDLGLVVRNAVLASLVTSQVFEKDTTATVERITKTVLEAIASRLSSAGDDELVARALKQGHEFAVLFLAFDGRDRHSSRMDKTLDSLSKMAVEVDRVSREAANRLEALSRKGRGE